MKKIIYFFIISFSTTASAQTWDWAFQGGGSGDDFGQGITTDLHGDVYLVADYMGNAYYSSTYLTGLYFANILIAKHDSVGNVLWVQKANGANSKGISIDSLGNCYITGSCGSNAIFYGTSNSITVTSQDGNAFIAKYDASGNVLWVQLHGYVISNDCGNAIKTDAVGNSYITGQSYYQDGTGQERYNYFLSKYDTQGNLLWTKNSNWRGGVNPTGLDIDENGNCYITGTFRDSAFFDNTILISNWNKRNTVFMAKYDKNGNVIWARKDGTNYSEAQGISLDKKENFYITGRYMAPSTFGSTQLTGTNPGASMFIAKYDTSGNNIWAKNASTGTWGRGVNRDTSGNCFVTGWMGNTATFGEGINTVTLISAKANREIFAAKYDKNGNLTWAVSPGGSTGESNQVMAIHSDEKNNCYITGGFSDSTIFGYTTLYAPKATHGYFDIFIAKLKDNNGITPIGIIATESNSSLNIYPNPTAGIFQINYSSAEKNKLQLNIIDSKGKTIFTETFQGDYNKVIDLGRKAKGIYLIEIVSDKKRVTKRVVLN